jgi:hypothetical protein
MKISAPLGDCIASHRLQSLADNGIRLDTAPDDLMRFGTAAVIVIEK